MYPQQICTTCTEKIESAYIFKQKCHEVFEKLRKYLETTSQTPVLIVPDNDEKVSEEKYFICIDDSSWKCQTYQEDVKKETLNSLTLIDSLPKADSETLAITKTNSNLDSTIETQPGVIAVKTESLEFPKKHNEIENSLPLDYKTENDNPLHNSTLKTKRRQVSSSKSDNKFNRLQQLIPKSQTLHCEVCGQDIKRKYFYRHLKTHTEEPRKCNCEICGKELSRANYLRHLKIHTGEKPHKCNMCDAAFISTTSLYEHQKIHSSAKDYLCQYCEKAFKQYAQLRCHIRLKHTGNTEISIFCKFYGNS